MSQCIVNNIFWLSIYDIARGTFSSSATEPATKYKPPLPDPACLSTNLGHIPEAPSLEGGNPTPRIPISHCTVTTLLIAAIYARGAFGDFDNRIGHSNRKSGAPYVQMLMASG
ncbi:hypothetical protein P153DRAFT_110491 [Dothidotthia symphoricarpi CBS 119687]|uniref:Uncharacterized protein n=1 Tax=Dothidotthia symphoricarpi CBS 119687 TaxID=1392245 RepID=A0A6A6A093_9PLEO|nr:uncharacterized protein P153DRAFT_110491 [Dothidotthia symphoricarpi CBS 119687]KAF2125249.1 hypothetical protein P153DRAFT_110491 [Dothidotthia symphoricarpi CBS 119687]